MKKSQIMKKCQLVEFPVHKDERGNLCVLQYNKYVPFKPARTFWVWGVPKGQQRGEHAHRYSTQIHVCLHGTATIKMNDGENKEIFILDSPSKGLLVQPMVWGGFELSSQDSCLVVISSHDYDSVDYIKDFDEFLSLVEK